jgi:sporulation protein YlmC with PRC-barrel domain
MNRHQIAGKGTAMADKDDISTEWTGHDLLDVNGEKIGTVEDVRYGEATAEMKWLLVKTGLFGTKKILVPAGEVRATEEALVVPYEKDIVKDAPGVDEDQVFTEDEERRICRYYGLDYISSFGSPIEGCARAGDESAVLSPQAPERR